MDTKRLIKQLQIDEGCIDFIYRDHLGYPTFGVGHLVTDLDPENGMAIGTRIKPERISQALFRDLDNAILDANSVIGLDVFESLPDEVQEVVVNMTFNLGRTKFSKFVKFIAALKKGDWNEAAKEGRDSIWYHQVNNRAERLMTRLENIS